ncbi:MAG: zinc-dependent metalloprotease, partial [Gemmataceae bacterium]|nr:zinc-dependent metalloprotease [Gemmataceae bacterium]
MNRQLFTILGMGALLVALSGHSTGVGQNPAGLPAPRFPDLETFAKGAKEYDGLFKLHQKDETVYAEIKFMQLGQPFLCPISIARGPGGAYVGGDTLNFGEQWVLVFKRVGDKVFLVRRNVRFQARAGTAVAKAVETTYTDSVLMSLPIRALSMPRQSLLISLNDIFMTDFAQLRRGFFDASRSSWVKVKAFPKNIELQVAATYAGGRSGDDQIDGRGATIVIHYGLCQLPEPGFQPRIADDRVGHFLSVVKDYTNDTKDTPFLRYVNRWRLERSDGSVWKEGGKLVAPKKKIVFWIEKSVPEEYRAYVREGILEWNKAFAKIGFRDAIEVRQQENEDFDPEDINYNTFRWITTDRGFAKGPSRANPLTGEIFDADIIFDASMVRYYRNDASIFGGSAAASDISPIRAQQRGMGLGSLEMAGEGGWDTRGEKALDAKGKARFQAITNGLCECGPCLKRELNLLSMALMIRDGDKDKEGGVLPEELIGQAIKEVTMHEVGHTLGLRHNFKASTMLKNEDLHKTEITRTKGLVGSVMDYAPVNLAPKGVKQGDYFTTTLGPYDYWVIEYAYRPLAGGTEGEAAELRNIAKKCAAPGHDFSTDEDLYTSSDPLVNTWDLGSDPMKFAQDRMLLAEELLGKLAEKGAKEGEGYQKTRQAFATLLREYGNAAFLIGKFVGGVRMHRDHAGDPQGREPFVVIEGDKQRAALKFLSDHLLTDKPFNFSPKLLRRLGSDRWLHWGNERAVMASPEYPVHERVLAIQRVVLDHVLDGSVLARVQNNALRSDKEAKPLAMAEVFTSMTEAIWAQPAKGAKVELSLVKRNLQREHLKELSGLVLKGYGAPPDARSLARQHLKGIAA